MIRLFFAVWKVKSWGSWSMGWERIGLTFLEGRMNTVCA